MEGIRKQTDMGISLDVGITEKRVEAAATALINQRVMRNGSPPIINVLDLLPPHLRVELLGDVRAALEAALAE